MENMKISYLVIINKITPNPENLLLPHKNC